MYSSNKYLQVALFIWVIKIYPHHHWSLDSEATHRTDGGTTTINEVAKEEPPLSASASDDDSVGKLHASIHHRISSLGDKEWDEDEVEEEEEGAATLWLEKEQCWVVAHSESDFIEFSSGVHTIIRFVP